MRRVLRLVFRPCLAFAFALPGCTDASAGPTPVPRAPSESLLRAAAWAPRRPAIDGRDFPDGVVALTWDDGPDAGTLDLARWLESRHVSATFFVVGAWTELSDEPGVGPGIATTGYEKLPILADLVAHGHRLGAHTANHVVLAGAPDATVVDQIGRSTRAIAPFVTNDLLMFRAPGGAWDREAAAALASDPALDRLVGPIRWDVDGKDWEASLSQGDEPPDACEPGPREGAPRVRARVVAQRYLRRIVSARRGIVLLHDRVGDVGSRYARDVAEALVPALERDGWVFAAPVLAFSDLAPRAVAAPPKTVGPPPTCDALGSPACVLGDLNGDGRPDACAMTRAGVACAFARPLGGFTSATIWSPARAGDVRLGDVNGDRRADLCVVAEGQQPLCGLAP